MTISLFLIMERMERNDVANYFVANYYLYLYALGLFIIRYY